MKYKEYQATVEYDEENETFYGIVTNTQDVIHFEGRSVRELKSEFKKSVEAYLQACKELGQEPERPFSGKFQVRLPLTLHRNAALAAKHSGISMNAFVSKAIEHEIDRSQI